jgi:excisionase family DNA binding protein
MSTATASPNQLLTTDEAAELLGVRPNTLEQWRCAGKYGLRYLRVGRLIRYRLRDLEAWLDAHCVGADAEE